jgi:hypothetical protein
MNPKIDISVLHELEASVGNDNALGTVQIGDATWLLVSRDNDNAVVTYPDERTLSSHEWFSDMLRWLGLQIDQRWNVLPVDDPQRPSPVVVLAQERGVYVLHRTINGVCAVEELFSSPGQIISDDSRLWSSFAEALGEAADDADYTE